MSTTLAILKRNGPTTEAALDALLAARQWGYADDTRRLTVMESDGVTLRRFWDSTRLADQTTSYGTALIGTPGITGITPDGGSSGSAATLQAMLKGMGAAIVAGSGTYIQNTTSQQATSNFNISGAGVIGTTLTVSGNMIVGSGSVGINTWFSVRGTTGGGSGTSQYGIASEWTIPSTATSEANGFYSGLTTATASFTLSNLYNYRVVDAVKGAGSTITTQYGLYVDSLAAGGTNYSIYTNAGLVRIGGAATFVSTVDVTGNFNINTDKFTVAASSGNTLVAGTFAVTSTSAFTGATTHTGGVIFNGGGTTLNHYEKGTFTATLYGVSGTVTGTANYVRIGSMVVIHLPQLSGTSNATNFGFSGIPASIRPSTDVKVGSFSFVDNGTFFAGGEGYLQTDGFAVFLRNGSLTGWTNTGTKAITGAGDNNHPTAFSYMIS